ncbi:MAG: hypothetical protein PHC68_00460 [Syntrophorhabdaceae bacterium]|nr:hypothetical protein [Syntrophorhabdaceae bacterium]
MQINQLRKPDSVTNAKAKLEEFQQAIQPIIKAMITIETFCVRKITLHEDGRIEKEYPEQAQEILQKCKDIIDRFREAFFNGE